MDLAVIGSRAFNDYIYLKSILDTYNNIESIISGGAQGADKLAAQYARKTNIKLIEFLPDWDKFGRSAGIIRNKEIINKADEVAAFWDGFSNGTKFSINYAKLQNKPVKVYWKMENNTK